MSGDGDGFLTRWSRLKRAASEPPKVVRPEPAEEPTEAADETEVFDPASLEIPLPSLDDLKPGDTLVAFMQKGVPEAIRNAAMRKMWALDPMVRDFRSEALDYAYDWNTPGGVPGAGPLGPADRIDEMVEALFRRRPTEEPTDAVGDDPQGEVAATRRESASEPVQHAEAPEETDDPATLHPRLTPPEGREAPHGEPVGEAVRDPLGEPQSELIVRRRHGGAMPQA